MKLPPQKNLPQIQNYYKVLMNQEFFNKLESEFDVIMHLTGLDLKERCHYSNL